MLRELRTPTVLRKPNHTSGVPKLMKTLPLTRAMIAGGLVLTQLLACGARTEFELTTDARMRDAVADARLRDVGFDSVADAGGPDGAVMADVVRRVVSDAECNPATVQQDCLLALHATQDPEAVFQCCDGHCESGSCEGRCNARPCDAHDGWFCCLHTLNRQLSCTRRDRGLCGAAP